MKIIISVSLLLLSLVADAQNNLAKAVQEITVSALVKGSFSGKIINAKSNSPLVGASIYLSDARMGSSTDINGDFFIKNIPEGRHLIEISHIGFTSLVEYIDIYGAYKKDFALTESVVENNAVIVTGVTKATQLKKVPFQVAILKKEDLAQTVATNIIEALTKKPGVSSLSSGPAISKPVIRGLGYNRVLTINDGVRQEGQQWGDEHGIEIDEASVNKIEILKGPASIIYGSDAMAGVINIITNVPVANNTLKTTMGSNYQSNNRLQSFNFSVGSNKNGVNWNFYSSNKKARDYQNKFDDYVFNSKFKESNVGGYAGYNGNWGYSHLLISKFNLTAGMVEGERDEQGYFTKNLPGGNTSRATENDFKSYSPTQPYQNIQHFKIATDNSFRIGKNRLILNIGWQRNQRAEFSNSDNLKEKALYFDLKTITHTLQLHFKESNGWKTSIGVNGMNQQNTNKGVEQLIPDYTANDIGAFIYTQKDLNEKITISGGARFDNRNINSKDLLDGTDIKGLAFKKSFSNFSGTAGLTAALTNEINLKINFARAFRAPSIPELASNGNHEGTNRYEYGNRDLKSETSLQFDGGFEFNTDHMSFGLSTFYNGFSNFIFYRKLQSLAGGDSLVNVNGNDLMAFQFDQRKANLSGLEATLDFHPHPLDWLHIQNTFSMVGGRLKEKIESSDYLPFMPAARLITEFRAAFNKPSDHIRNFYAKLEFDNSFAQNHVFTAYNTETKTAGYLLLNAGIGTDITDKKGNTILNIYLAGTNLGDIAYQNHLSRLKYTAENKATGRQGVYNMGRNFSIKINIPLSITIK